MIESYKKIAALLSRNEKKGFYLLILIMVAGAVLEMTAVGIIPVYMTAIAYPERVMRYGWFSRVDDALTMDLQDDTSLIVFSSLVLIGFFVFKALFSVFSSYCKIRYAQNRTRKLSVRLFRNYLFAPYSFHLTNSTPLLFRNINAECRQLSSKVLMPMIEMISQSLILSGILLVLSVSVPINILIGLIAYLSFGMLAASIFQKKVKKLGIVAQNHRATVVRSVKEGLEGVREIKFTGSASFFINRLNSALLKIFDIQKTINILQQGLPTFIELLAITGLIGVTLILYMRGEGGEAIIPVIAVFTIALARMKGSMSAIMRNFTDIRYSSVSLDLVYDALVADNCPALAEMSRTQQSEANEKKNIKFSDSITLRNLSYKYPGSNKFALSEINLEIRKGEALGIIGKTGSGKSTLVDIITGLLEPTRGDTLVDHENVSGRLGDWYPKIGYVPQSVFLIDGSVRENIIIGMEQDEITSSDFNQAVTAAKIDQLVTKLQQGMETRIGDQGKKLSGGERQRIAIARALLRQPELLVLDEATSALDNITESEVIRAVEELKGRLTILVIAHRLSTVRHCDRILFMKEGCISDTGTFTELESRHADFFRMTGTSS